MSTLLDRYLAAIGRELPMRQAAEITAELRDVLMSKIEDRAADLGRPLTDKEIEQVLIDFGHPLIVAGNYRKTQYLIGPELFPMWVATLRFVLGFWAAILIVSLFVAAVATPSATPGWVLRKAGEAVWPGFLFVFAVVTLVFAVNERMGRYCFKLHFDPRRLPPAPARGRKPAEIITQMALGVVALLWWVGLIRFRAFMPIPSFLGVHLASTWDAFRGPIIGYLVAEFVINGLELLRPACVRLIAGLNLAKTVAGGVILALVLQAGHWIDIDAPSLSVVVREMIQKGFDHGFRLGLLVTLVVLAIQTLFGARRLWKALGGDGGHADGAAAAALES